MEFLVAQGDPKPGGGFKNTLDLRGWTMHWSYDKDNLHASVGSGDITFSNDPLWAAVPRGTMITVSEWSDVWYDKTTGTRDGGYNGLGILHGNPFNSATDMYIGASSATPTVDPHLYATDTSWNPGANGGGANGDWNIHVFAGELNPDTSFKYFNFSGSVTTTSGTFAIGTDDGGLFTANNDNWQYTITDQDSNVIQGPYGEQDTGWAPLGASVRPRFCVSRAASTAINRNPPIWTRISPTTPTDRRALSGNQTFGARAPDIKVSTDYVTGFKWATPIWTAR